MSDIWEKPKLPQVHLGNGEYPWQVPVFTPNATQVPMRHTPLLTPESIAYE